MWGWLTWVLFKIQPFSEFLRCRMWYLLCHGRKVKLPLPSAPSPQSCVSIVHLVFYFFELDFPFSGQIDASLNQCNRHTRPWVTHTKKKTFSGQVLQTVLCVSPMSETDQIYSEANILWIFIFVLFPDSKCYLLLNHKLVSTLIVALDLIIFMILRFG